MIKIAAKELWDYLTTAAADVPGSTLATPYPQKVLVETGTKKQTIHIFDDNSEQRISFVDAPKFYVPIQWDGLSEADSGTIFDFWLSSAIGNGIVNSFRWAHPTDGHKYTVRFDSDISRSIYPGAIFEHPPTRLRILGRATSS